MKLSMILAMGFLLFAIGLIVTDHYRSCGEGAQEYSVVSALMDINSNQQQLLELHRSQLATQIEILNIQRLQYQQTLQSH